MPPRLISRVTTDVELSGKPSNARSIAPLYNSMMASLVIIRPTRFEIDTSKRLLRWIGTWSAWCRRCPAVVTGSATTRFGDQPGIPRPFSVECPLGDNVTLVPLGGRSAQSCSGKSAVRGSYERSFAIRLLRGFGVAVDGNCLFGNGLRGRQRPGIRTARRCRRGPSRHGPALSIDPRSGRVGIFTSPSGLCLSRAG